MMEVIKDKLNIENLIDIDRGHCMGNIKTIVLVQSYLNLVSLKANRKYFVMSKNKNKKTPEYIFMKTLQRHIGSKEIFVG